MFGEFIKNIRLKKRTGLREFCIKSGRDASNWSKIERGALPPPKDQESLEKIACDLGLEKGSKEWMELFDLAFAERGVLPTDIMSDKELVKSLPLFFRTLRGEKPNNEELNKMAELIRRS